MGAIATTNRKPLSGVTTHDSAVLSYQLVSAAAGAIDTANSYGSPGVSVSGTGPYTFTVPTWPTGKPPNVQVTCSDAAGGTVIGVETVDKSTNGTLVVTLDAATAAGDTVDLLVFYPTIRG